MAPGRDKKRLRRNLLIVRNLLNEEWDPIGGCPDDEYETYANKLYVMLMHENRSAEEMGDYLYWVESEYMGLGKHDQQRIECKRVAEKLISMRPILDAANDD